MYKWLLFTLPAHNFKEIRRKSQQKIMISLLITTYPQTESEIKEKTTKQPWFLDCHQLLLSMFCRTVILSWTSNLHKKKVFCIVKYFILKQNYRTWLKMKIASYVYRRNKLVSHRKNVSKITLQTSFLCIYVFLYNRKSISLGIPEW